MTDTHVAEYAGDTYAVRYRAADGSHRLGPACKSWACAILSIVCIEGDTVDAMIVNGVPSPVANPVPAVVYRREHVAAARATLNKAPPTMDEVFDQLGPAMHRQVCGAKAPIPDDQLDGEFAAVERRSTHYVHRGPESLPCYCAGTLDHAIGDETAAAPAAQVECEYCAGRGRIPGEIRNEDDDGSDPCPECDATGAKPAAPAAQVAVSADRDAYEGAREDLLDWKRRAQRAEAELRRTGYTGITPDQPKKVTAMTADSALMELLRKEFAAASQKTATVDEVCRASDMEESRAELLQEEIDCYHKAMDEAGFVGRTDDRGCELSLYGRAKFAMIKFAEKREAAQVVEHPDDIAVDKFAAAMKEKLAAARAKGRGGWDDSEDLEQHLSNLLRAHVDKGDPRDVANFCCFLWNRGESICAAPAAQVAPYGWVLTGPNGDMFVPATHRHIIDATLQVDGCSAVTIYTTPPQPQDAEDAARLDFIESKRFDLCPLEGGGFDVYRYREGSNETILVASGATAREAIDAARAAEGGERG